MSTIINTSIYHYTDTHTYKSMETEIQQTTDIDVPIPIESIDSATVGMQEAEEETTEEIVEETTEEIIQEEKYNLSENDKYLLAKISMAEAGIEDIYGKAYVIMVVLNRIDSEQFPDTIYEIITQKNQFSPVSNGTFYELEPSDECYNALEMVINGWDNSQGALYFESCPNANNWHSRNLEYLFTHGGHRFYK